MGWRLQLDECQEWFKKIPWCISKLLKRAKQFLNAPAAALGSHQSVVALNCVEIVPPQPG
jgi:hypothetical protein